VSRLRSSSAHLTAALLAAAGFAGGQTGAGGKSTVTPSSSIKEKKPVFGGACRLCPWGAMAEVVQAAMRPYGYVQICCNCNAVDSTRIVSQARTPARTAAQRSQVGY
jgi:hypothetical protein